MERPPKRKIERGEDTVSSKKQRVTSNKKPKKREKVQRGNWQEPAQTAIDIPVEKILSIIRTNPAEYNVRGDKIVRTTGRVFEGSNVRESLRFIIGRKDGKSLGKAPEGTHIFEQMIRKNPAIMEIVQPKERGVKRGMNREAMEFERIGEFRTSKWEPLIPEKSKKRLGAMQTVPPIKKIFKKNTEKSHSKVTQKRRKDIKWASVQPTPENIRNILAKTNPVQRNRAQAKPTPENIAAALNKKHIKKETIIKQEVP